MKEETRQEIAKSILGTDAPLRLVESRPLTREELLTEINRLGREVADLRAETERLRAALKALTTECTTNPDVMDHISLSVLGAAIAAEGPES